jgi:hypothetical protein
VTCSSSCTRIFHFLVYLNKLMDTSSNYQNTRQWYKEKKRKNKNYINNKHFCTVYEFHVYLVRVAVPITHIYTRNLLLEYIYLLSNYKILKKKLKICLMKFSLINTYHCGFKQWFSKKNLNLIIKLIFFMIELF